MPSMAAAILRLSGRISKAPSLLALQDRQVVTAWTTTGLVPTIVAIFLSSPWSTSWG